MAARIPVPSVLAHDPFSNHRGRAAGLGSGRLRGHDLHAPFRGVRVVADPIGIRELAEAFYARAADNTFFCSVTAARLLRVPLPARLELARVLHVGVPAPARSPRAQGVIGHKFQIEPDDLREWDGLRITTPERTWCDLSLVLSVPDLVAAGDYIIHRELPLASVHDLELALQRHAGRRGRAKLFRAIDQLNDRSESRQESLLRVVVVTAGIPGIAPNEWITTSGGYRYRGDLIIPERKVVIEYQSRFHDATKEFRADMTRISRLEADGWYVIQVNRDDLDDPRELGARIRTVLRSRPRFP